MGGAEPADISPAATIDLANTSSAVAMEVPPT